MPDATDNSIVRKLYVSNLGFKSPIGVLKYRRGGSKSDLVVIIWIPQGTSTSSTNFIKTIPTACREVPSHLSRSQNYYTIALIQAAVEKVVDLL